MLICCDGDGVVCDLHVEWLKRYNRDYNDTLTYKNWTSWSLHTLVKPECGVKIYDYLTMPDLYDDVPETPGAAEAIKYIRETLGHRLFFSTTCTVGMTDPKADWLYRHGFTTKKRPNDLGQELVVLQQKDLVQGDLLIDDAIHNIDAWRTTGRGKALLYDRPWNQDTDHWHSKDWLWVRRVHNWQEIVAYLEGGAK